MKVSFLNSNPCAPKVRTKSSMHQPIQSGVTTKGERFQKSAFRIVLSLGIAVWAGLIVQLKVEGMEDAASNRAAKPWMLTSICSSDATISACINGCWVGVSDEIPAQGAVAKILSISRDGVLLNWRGERFVLRIHDRDVRWDLFEVTR